MPNAPGAPARDPTAALLGAPRGAGAASPGSVRRGSAVPGPTAVRSAHGPAQRDELPRSGGEDGREGLVRLAGLRRGAGPDCAGAGARL